MSSLPRAFSKAKPPFGSDKACSRSSSNGSSFFARLGYSWRQTDEMRGVDAFNLSGFSFGVGMRRGKFEFSYARRNYHLSQAPNYLTLSYRF